MRCDECKNWDADYQWSHCDEGLRPKVGLCTKAQPYWETTEWVRDGDDGDEKIARATRAEFVGLKMFVQDGSNYSADLLTTPDFFCAHFDARN